MNDITKELKELMLVADLFYYEGPVVSLLVDKKGSLFIYKWCGINEEANAHRWLVFVVSSYNLEKYINKTISEAQLIDKALNRSIGGKDTQYILVDIDENLAYTYLNTFTTDSLPNEYQSKNFVYFDADYCDGYLSVLQILSRNNWEKNKPQPITGKYYYDVESKPKPSYKQLFENVSYA